MKQTQTDWEEAYQRRETPWEKGKPHPALVDFVTENGPLAGEIFVPGCGSGHDVRALVTPENHVVGIDLAPFAIKKANDRLRIAQEEYMLGDLFALPATLDESFDWVFEHTCFCAIEPARRDEYVDAVAAALVPGGALVGLFYAHGRPGGPPFTVDAGELRARFGRRFIIDMLVPAAGSVLGRQGQELLARLVRAS